MKTRKIDYQQAEDEYKLDNKNKIYNEEIHNEEINNEEVYNEIVYTSFYIEKIGQIIITIFNFIIKSIIFIFNISSIYFLWIFLHYTSSHLYIKLCVPDTIIGFVLSPFMTATPHCQGLRWIVYNGANMINNMWIILGTWITANILVINRNNIV